MTRRHRPRKSERWGRGIEISEYDPRLAGPRGTSGCPAPHPHPARRHGGHAAKTELVQELTDRARRALGLPSIPVWEK
ncbi:hypothetical protein [Amycolatopsis lurida]|uniref:hypothetical protein n=1 Tax=Amycolatopsis lurida TaxID=31959 RepID=UPI00366A1947